MKNSKKKKGSSILLVLVVSMTILVFSATSISAVMYTSKGNQIKVQEDDLFYIAESGFEHGYATLMETGSENIYSKSIDGANVEISISKESDKLYRIKSEATKEGNSKIVQGLIQDKRVMESPTNYSEIISKYVVNAEGVSIGSEGSIFLQYVNSKTDIEKSSDVTLGMFDQPNESPEDKKFTLPSLKLKHSNKLKFSSMKEMVDFGVGKAGDLENTSVVTEDYSAWPLTYKVVFVNADFIEIDIPTGGEIYGNLILITPGSVKFTNIANTALYSNTSIICKELIISNNGQGAINISPQPNINDLEQKNMLDELINKYISTPTTGGGTINEWVIEEMSY